jgi:hypothetical protein
VEVWDGKEWQTFDPTPASLRPGNAQEGLLRVYALALTDWVNYFWDRHILTFGLVDQLALAVAMLERIRSATSAINTAVHSSALRTYASFLTILIVAGFAVVLLSRRRRSLFDLLAEHLHRLGIKVGASMTMSEALQELQTNHPAAATELAPLIELYEAERFSGRVEQGRVSRIRRRLAEMSES